MEKNSESNLNRWVEDRLASLHPENDWRPNTARGFAQLRERRNAKHGQARRWAWVAAATAATSLSLAAFPTTRAFTRRCVSACVEETSLVRRLLVGTASGSSVAYIKAADRSMAPDFTLNDASGTPVRLSEARGKVVLLNFWATWCEPCRTEIPWFSEFQEAHRDLAVMGVSLDEDGWEAVRPYMGSSRINYRVMVGSNDIAHLYPGLDGLPTTFIIDKSGRIAAIHLGICSKQEYEADIEAVLNEK